MELYKSRATPVVDAARGLTPTELPDFRKPTIMRSVIEENRMALTRRWSFVQSGLLDDEKAINRWFPHQRNLLEILGTVSFHEVARMAECSTPLFGVTIPAGISPGVFRQCTPVSELEAQSVDEIFMFLSVRLDCLRLSTPQAGMYFCLTNNETNRLSRLGPHELRALSRDPMMHIYPVASDNYFVAAATRTMTEAEKTVLATVSRRSRDSIR